MLVVVRYEKAAALGHAPAMVRLAEVYLNDRGGGKGCERPAVRTG